jgi:ABC-type branched-subunit amino acid transport system ATPase component
MSAFLALRGVVGGYGGGDVLQGVDLEVERGSITCFRVFSARASDR